MNASSTVRLGFDEVAVAADDVIVELPFDEWQTQDRLATARPNPAAFGLAATSTRWLAERDAATAAALEDERLDCRARSYAADPTDVDTLVALRAWSLELALRCAYALVAATGGRSMMLTHPAQRLLREAAFYAIQAQTPALRASTLGRLTAR
jgi:alkylation response protein AidB-like acyl-CoA dehydrogenase